jgi:hypothetical protein
MGVTTALKTRPDAACSSDHKLLTAKVKIKLKNTQTTKKWILDTDNIPEDYKSDIQEKLTRLKLDGGNAEKTWKMLKDTIKDAADKHIPERRRKKGPAWISQDTLRVVAERRQMRVEEKWAGRN